MPVQNEPPRLLAIARSLLFDDLSLMAYADVQCAFTEKGFEAALLLLSIYWVLNINFPKTAKFQFSFLAVADLKGAVTASLENILKLPSFLKVIS